MTAPLSPGLASRALADSRDRPAWLLARTGNIGGSDAANFSKVESVPSYIRAKVKDGWAGNKYSEHGNSREAAILAQFGIEQNTTLFRSVDSARHVATPDAIRERADGSVLLAQVKALDHDPRTKGGSIPPRYLRQCWWEQHVMGPAVERTIFIWEVHHDFQPINFEADSVWIDRDEDEISKLVRIANLVVAGIDAAAEFIPNRRSTE